MAFSVVPWRREALEQSGPAEVRLPVSGLPVPAQITPIVLTVTSGVPTAPVSAEPSAASGSSVRIPPRWAVGLVSLVLILAAVLIGVGKPAGAVMAALGAAGYFGVELVRQLNRDL